MDLGRLACRGSTLPTELRAHPDRLVSSTVQRVKVVLSGWATWYRNLGHEHILHGVYFEHETDTKPTWCCN